MKRNYSKLMAVVLVVVTLLSVNETIFSVNAATLTQSQFDSKLDSVKSMYPNGSQKYEWSVNGSVVGWQCHGYARWISWYVWGGDFANGRGANWTLYKSTSSSTYIDKLVPGDVVRYRTSTSKTYNHSIFITSISGDTIYFTDCNSDGNNTIKWGRSISKSTLASYLKTSLYGSEAASYGYIAHYTLNTLGSNLSCTCSTSYAGNYTCTTSSSPLNIRSGHGSSYGVIGSIPSGATVYVSKASGTSVSDWAHVTYNGISGYASMEYLKNQHTHSYSQNYEAAHPHRVYKKCSCGDWYYTGATTQMSTCKSCWYINFDCSTTSVSLKVGDSSRVTVNIEGFWPDSRLLVESYDKTVISATIGGNYVTFSGLKKGSTKYILTLYSDSTKSYVIGKTAISITVSDKTYTISYNANGGTGAPSSQTKIYGTDLKLTTSTPKRTGYSFSKWNTNSDGSGTSYNSGGTYTPNVSDTLYAIWKANSYTIKYNANGGSGSMSDTTHYYDTAKSLRKNTYTRSGYTFLGWSTSSSSTSPTYYDGQSVKNLTSNNDVIITLYAVWGDTSAPVAKLSSTHNTASSQTVSFTFSDNDGIAGYYWGTSSNYRSNIFTTTSSSSASKTVTNEGTYYLTVKDKNGNLSVTYKIGFSRITLNGNGGTVSPAYIIVETGSGITLPACARSEYTFMGWNKSSNADSGLMYVTVSDNSTYYAIWKSNAVPVSMQITKAPNKINYYIGDTLDVNGIELSVTYSDGSVKKINNSTINSGVELQNTNLKAEGEKKITVVYGDFKDTFTVYVKSPTISLSDYEVHLNKGEQYNITVTTNPENVTIKADSSDKRIATIENGVVKAVGVGKADITIRFTYNGLTYKEICKVTVEEPQKITFPDVPDSAWYAEAVYYCADKGYITGTDKGTFEPDGKLTREQFVVILARVAGADLDEYTVSSFEDVNASAWYGPSIIWAYENGYVNGVGDGTNFGVGQDMTREQLATMFYRYAEKQGVSVTGKADLSIYNDVNSIGSWAKDACAWAVNAGLLSSTSTSTKTLSPKMSVTRAQAAKIFMSYDTYAK